MKHATFSINDVDLPSGLEQCSSLVHCDHRTPVERSLALLADFCGMDYECCHWLSCEMENRKTDPIRAGGGGGLPFCSYRLE
jgi:hypothetical protein